MNFSELECNVRRYGMRSILGVKRRKKRTYRILDYATCAHEQFRAKLKLMGRLLNNVKRIKIEISLFLRVGNCVQLYVITDDCMQLQNEIL